MFQKSRNRPSFESAFGSVAMGKSGQKNAARICGDNLNIMPNSV
jgi:hypothetical protein